MGICGAYEFKTLRVNGDHSLCNCVARADSFGQFLPAGPWQPCRSFFAPGLDGLADRQFEDGSDENMSLYKHDNNFRGLCHV